MANNIQVAEWFENLVDQGYLANSKTNIFNSGKITPVGEGYGKFKVMKVSTDGIGTYDKAAGYAESATTVGYEEIVPDIDLSSSITIDHFDNEETMKKALVYGYSDIQDKLIREVDAIRIASIFKQADETNKVASTLTTGDDVVKALRNAITDMDNNRVYNDKILLATPSVLGALEDMDIYKSKQILSNFVNTVKMENDIFLTAIDVATGRDGNWNYKAADGAKNINFMIVSKSAVDCSAKARTKFIASDVNPILDADSMKIRFYALSAYVFENEKDGIYINYQA